MSSAGEQNTAPPEVLEDFLRRYRPDREIDPAWLEQMKLARQNETKRLEEREAERRLVVQLIDAGYRSLATKLHPDRGGSWDAMSRLSRVRDQLKSLVEARKWKLGG